MPLTLYYGRIFKSLTHLVVLAISLTLIFINNNKIKILAVADLIQWRNIPNDSISVISSKCQTKLYIKRNLNHHVWLT